MSAYMVLVGAVSGNTFELQTSTYITFYCRAPTFLFDFTTALLKFSFRKLIELTTRTFMVAVIVTLVVRQITTGNDCKSSMDLKTVLSSIFNLLMNAPSPGKANSNELHQSSTVANAD